MAAFNKYNGFAQDVGRKLHNLHTDTLKITLSNTAPDLTDTNLASVAEIAAGNGFSAGGTAITTQSYTQTAGVGKLLGDDVVFTCVTAPMAAFRYVILYNATADLVIGWWDRGSALTLAVGETFTADMDAVNGILTVT